MKKPRILPLLIAGLGFVPAATQAQPVEASVAGLSARTPTLYVNQDHNNNTTSSLGVAITSDQDVVVGFEDDHNPGTVIRHWAAAWTLFNRDGTRLTPDAPVASTNPELASQPPTSITTYYRAFVRADGSPTPARTAWGPKVKSNPFGPGFGMGATAYAVRDPVSATGFNGPGNEITHLFPINFDASLNGQGLRVGGAFAPVQLINNNGTSAALTLAGGSEANYAPEGGVRIADWHYLANGNVVIVNESRQAADRALTGQETGNVVTYRVLKPSGEEVKGWTAVSSAPGPSDMWHGVAVTGNGFAIRWGFNGGSGQRTTLRFFDNNGNPVSQNVDLAESTGIAEAAAGGRGDGAGFQGNGSDAYVYAATSGGRLQVTVLNANGTLRWSRHVADEADENPPATDRVDAAIAPDGRVIVVFDAANQYPEAPGSGRVILGRMFSATGSAIGPIFRVSEKEGEFPPNALGLSRHPRVAWRNGLIAVVWESRGNSDVTPNNIAALRIFNAPKAPISEPRVGLSARTPTLYVNQDHNNNTTSSLGVAITSDQDVVVGFEDDHNPGTVIRHWAAAWTLFNRDGTRLTPDAPVASTNPELASQPPTSITTYYRAFVRADGSPTPARTAWGPKVKSNPFGPGFGMGATAYAVRDPVSATGFNGPGNEITHLFPINFDASLNGQGLRVGGAFAPVQLINNNGTSAALTLAGGSEANYAPEGGVRIADWHYLANGNVVIVNESRQAADRALTGQETGNVVTYRVLKPSGEEVKGWTAVSSAPGPSDMWHGVAVTGNGFAIRWGFNGGSGQRTTLRFFDNNGNPVSQNVDLAESTGIAEAAAGGRGDGAGFQGNGSDAYVYAATSGGRLQVTVLNANGTLRWSRHVADEADENPPATDRVDAAIAPDGRVIVVFDAANQYPEAPGSGRVILGRMFSATGSAIGPIFRVSEKEGEFPPNALGLSRHPRVAWRNGLIAVVWESRGNSDVTPNNIAALRIFNTEPSALPQPITLEAPSLSQGSLSITWSGGTPPFTVQRRASLGAAWTDAATNLVNRAFSTPANANESYFRVVDGR